MKTRPAMNIWESKNEENLLDIRIFIKHHLGHLLPARNQELILEKPVGTSEGVILCAHFPIDFVKESVPTLTLEHLEGAVSSGISFVYLSYFKRLKTDLTEIHWRLSLFSLLNAITARSRTTAYGICLLTVIPWHITIICSAKDEDGSFLYIVTCPFKMDLCTFFTSRWRSAWLTSHPTEIIISVWARTKAIASLLNFHGRVRWSKKKRCGSLRALQWHR